jgi:hypothetical protein
LADRLAKDHQNDRHDGKSHNGNQYAIDGHSVRPPNVFQGVWPTNSRQPWQRNENGVGSLGGRLLLRCEINSRNEPTYSEHWVTEYDSVVLRASGQSAFKTRQNSSISSSLIGDTQERGDARQKLCFLSPDMTCLKARSFAGFFDQRGGFLRRGLCGEISLTLIEEWHFSLMRIALVDPNFPAGSLAASSLDARATRFSVLRMERKRSKR